MDRQKNTLRAAAFLLALGVTGCGEKTTAPEDTVAPAAVSALAVHYVSRYMVEMEWQPGTEPDLTGYNVYRAKRGDDMVLVGMVTDATYVDRNVQTRTHYEYAVSALDTSENESPRVSTGEVFVPAATGGRGELN